MLNKWNELMNNNVIEEKSDILIYQAEDGKTRIDVRLEDETVWLTQISMAELFQTTVANINIHVKNILEEGELDGGATIKDYLIVRDKGRRRRRRCQLIIFLNIINPGFHLSKVRQHRQ